MLSGSFDAFGNHGQSLPSPLAIHTALLKDHALILGDRLDNGYSRSGIDLLWAVKTCGQRVGWYCQIYNQYQQRFGGQATFGLAGEILGLAPEVRDRHLQVQLSAMREVERFFELFYQTQVLSAELVHHSMRQDPQALLLSMPNGLYPFVSACDHADTLFHLIITNQIDYGSFRQWWQQLKQPDSQHATMPVNRQQLRLTQTVASQVLQKLATVYHHHLQQLQEQDGRQPSLLSLLGDHFSHAYSQHQESLRQLYAVPAWRNITMRLLDFCTAYSDYAKEAMMAGVMERRHFLAMLAKLQSNPYFGDRERKLLFGAVTDTTTNLEMEAKAKMAMRSHRPYPHGYGAATPAQKVAALRSHAMPNQPYPAAKSPNPAAKSPNPATPNLPPHRMVDGSFTDGAGLTLQ
ncbi:MAG: hypothetical protein FJX22_04160 [Alphaproteobacteria bacterium]|nr:hypothetical protein [Alphaproteobacteria bacterium]